MIRVFVNGTFDILHRGHLQLLSYAKSHGDVLYVGIDSDEMVKRLKGSDRPINNQEDRSYFLRSLKSVDRVEIFNSHEELTNLVKAISPDIMFVGEDWKGKPIVGSEHAAKLIYFPRIGDYSTTKTIQRISDGRDLRR